MPDAPRFKTRIGRVPADKVWKVPKVGALSTGAGGGGGDCTAMLASCLDTADVLGCTVGRLGDYLGCLTGGGGESLVTNVPCGDEEEGTHYMPYSVYLDWLRCTYEGSGGTAECDTFTRTDEMGREVTTKVVCDCPGEKGWDGRGCKCPENAPYDKREMEAAGGRMLGNCCAERLCGEGGDYDCETDTCQCAPGWYPDGSGGCTDTPCTPGPGGGEGCAEGNCCQTVGTCVLNDGQWDGMGNPAAPKTKSGCKAAVGRWETTDPNACPEEGHCELSICDLNRHYGTSGPPDYTQFAITACDPTCVADRCARACDSADPALCGGEWRFDSCDNAGYPPTCVCACVPP
jgi:hypothetical protein